MICKNRLLKKNGFTLIELLCSVMILAITALMISTNLSISFTLTQDVQDIVKSTDLAQKYIEEVKADLKYASNYDELSSGSTPPKEITNQYTNNGYFTVTTSINDLDNALINGILVTTLREINVSYVKSDDNTPLVQFSTIISRPGN